MSFVFYTLTIQALNFLSFEKPIIHGDLGTWNEIGRHTGPSEQEIEEWTRNRSPSGSTYTFPPSSLSNSINRGPGEFTPMTETSHPTKRYCVKNVQDLWWGKGVGEPRSPSLSREQKSGSHDVVGLTLSSIKWDGCETSIMKTIREDLKIKLVWWTKDDPGTYHVNRDYFRFRGTMVSDSFTFLSSVFPFYL